MILGPMFSGKTTELIRRLTIHVKAGFKVLYVNSEYDIRSEYGMSTHNPSLSKSQDAIPMIKTRRLMDTLDHLQHVQIVAVDEAHFFDDIVEFYHAVVEERGLQLLVCGLNGTSDRRMFGKLSELIPLCDNIVFIRSFCTICAANRIIAPAPFTKRLVNDTNTICIGGAESYIAVCRHHYGNS